MGSRGIMVMSRGAGGVGLDLNARHVFIMERQFEPFDDKQLEDRSVRVNQTGHVKIWYPSAGTELERRQAYIRNAKEVQAAYFLPKSGRSLPKLYEDFARLFLGYGVCSAYVLPRWASE